jgi:hypothetical protein
MISVAKTIRREMKVIGSYEQSCSTALLQMSNRQLDGEPGICPITEKLDGGQVVRKMKAGTSRTRFVVTSARGGFLQRLTRPTVLLLQESDWPNPADRGSDAQPERLGRFLHRLHY